jgi:hypothetical protein
MRFLATTRVIIEFDRMPIHFKTMEMSFGKVWRYAEEFPGPLQVARELGLDTGTASLEQAIHPYHRWNLIHSTTMYYEASVAAAQAQKLWDASGIQRLHKDGKVSRARYGYEKTETRYRRWLGGLEDPEHPWPKPQICARCQQNAGTDENLAGGDER